MLYPFSYGLTLQINTLNSANNVQKDFLEDASMLKYMWLRIYAAVFLLNSSSILYTFYKKTLLVEKVVQMPLVFANYCLSSNAMN